jgi:hypothetical protein
MTTVGRGVIRRLRNSSGISPRSPVNCDGTVALYVRSSGEDAYEHRRFQAVLERVPQAEVLTVPGGHLTTSEHPDPLAAAIRDVAERHGVGTAMPG